MKTDSGCAAHVIRDGRMGCQRCNTSWDRGEFPGCGRFPHAPDYLEAAAETFRERNALYGETYARMGALTLALFPEGGIPAVRTVEDANRLHLILIALTKLQRYAHNFHRGGHADSAHDLAVYAAMLEEMTVKEKE